MESSATVVAHSATIELTPQGVTLLTMTDDHEKKSPQGGARVWYFPDGYLPEVYEHRGQTFNINFAAAAASDKMSDAALNSLLQSKLILKV